MVDMVAHQALDLAPIRLLQRRKTSYIQRLEYVRRVWRHAESDNLIILAVMLEFDRVVALMAVENEQAILSSSTTLCMRIM